MTNKQFNKIFALYFASSISIFAPGSEEEFSRSDSSVSEASTVAHIPIHEHIKSIALNAMADTRECKDFVVLWSNLYFSLKTTTDLTSEKKAEFYSLAESSCSFFMRILESFQDNYHHLNVAESLEITSISKRSHDLVLEIFSNIDFSGYNNFESYTILLYSSEYKRDALSKLRAKECFLGFKGTARSFVINFIFLLSIFCNFSRNACLINLNFVENYDENNPCNFEDMFALYDGLRLVMDKNSPNFHEMNDGEISRAAKFINRLNFAI